MRTVKETTMHTIETILAFLRSQRESDEPDAVLAILKMNDGKQLTKRLLARLPGGEERWRLSQFATMTHLETRDYSRSGGNTGIHLLMAYQTTNVTIDVAWVEANNPAYFKGRRDRNASRDAAANDLGLLRAMVDTLNGYEAAKAKLDEAAKQLESFVGYGQPFAADSYDWERMCGAKTAAT
jgi:hypothetical protein